MQWREIFWVEAANATAYINQLYLSAREMQRLCIFVSLCICGVSLRMSSSTPFRQHVRIYSSISFTCSVWMRGLFDYCTAAFISFHHNDWARVIIHDLGAPLTQRRSPLNENENVNEVECKRLKPLQMPPADGCAKIIVKAGSRPGVEPDNRNYESPFSYFLFHIF